MNPFFSRLKPLYQSLFVICAIAFICLAYKHHSGNNRFLNYFHKQLDNKEAGFIKMNLMKEYPKLESIDARKSPNRNLMHLFEAKQSESEVLTIARIKKELSCKECRALDFLVVINQQHQIQWVKLIDPILITGKTINPTEFLIQFKGKSFESPIRIGSDVKTIDEAQDSAEAIVQGISELLKAI
ncbi:MAG: hypothetical protein Q8Q33_03290 [Chlamydiota bacterium]|nr:hypothetical protein [Chlamydiota bacterium]